MKRRPTLLLSFLLLLAGISVGTILDSASLTKSVKANALDPAEVERLHRELNGKGNTLVEKSELLAKIARLTTPGVVHIQSTRKIPRRGTIEETGSGVIITSSKAAGVFVVTNRHVVDAARREDISVHLHDGRVVQPERIWSDQASDVAIMKINVTDVIPARWGDSDDVEIGHMVLAMGSPFGLSQSVTYGIISAKGRRSLKLGPTGAVLNQNFLQTDAAINPGNSGGPLIDMHGRIIGINTAIASNSGGNEGIGFSIPSNLVRRISDQLLEHGKVQRAYLGVKLDPQFDAQAARRLKLDRVRGARIVEVYPNTPAARAHLKFDDVVIMFDGLEVQDENHLINLVSLTAVGSTARLSVLREGRRIKIQVKLADRAELERRSEVTRPSKLGTPVEPTGLTLHKFDSSLASQIGLSETRRGLVVLHVDSTSPFFGQVELYDLIEEVGRKPVRSLTDFDRTLDELAPKLPVVLKVRRLVDGQPESRLIIWNR